MRRPVRRPARWRPRSAVSRPASRSVRRLPQRSSWVARVVSWRVRHQLMRRGSARSRPLPGRHHCLCTGSARRPALICEGNADRAPGRGGDARSCHPCAAWLLGTARWEITGAQGARTAWRLFGTIVTDRARHLERCTDTKLSRWKNQVGLGPEKLRNGTRTLRRNVGRTIVDIRHQPRRNRHTAIGEGHSGGRAIGHTDLGCARSGEGTGVDSQGFQLSNA